MAVRDDIVNILAIPLGRSQALALLNDAEVYIRSQAEIGARKGAVDALSENVRKYRPFLIAAGGLFGLTVFMATVAFARSLRPSKR